MKQTFLAFTLLALTASVAVAGVTKGTYVGTSSTRVWYYNPGTLRPIATESCTCNETVVIGAPRKSGVLVESNPFSLTILATKPRVPQADGDLKISSARILPVYGGGSVVAQYWQLQNTDAGFIGALTDNHLADGLIRDRLIARARGFPLPPIFPSWANAPDRDSVVIVIYPEIPSAGFRMNDASIDPARQCMLTAIVTGRRMELTISGCAFLPGQSSFIGFTTKINARR